MGENPGDSLGITGGTSFAVASMMGTAAVIKQMRPDMTMDGLFDVVGRTSDYNSHLQPVSPQNIGNSGHISAKGYLDFLGAIEASKTWQPEKPPETNLVFEFFFGWLSS
jgi:hypothetical protein